ncbi:hypothetical protein [Winogradskyella sp.]|uniref:hypothetical protein n=1 Tax=Winogradskyella sp. TaxID=1883156 RepID=UPI003BAB1E97
MKNYLKFIVLPFLVCALSCDQGIEELETHQTTESAKSTQPGPSAVDILESYLQVTAFLTAQVLYQADPNNNTTNQLVLTEFENALSTPNDSTYNSLVRVVNLDDLLGTNSQTPNFENAFKARFNDYFGDETEDRKCRPKGGHPNITCPDCAIDSNPTYQSFIDVVIFENCIELYLPNGYKSSDLSRFNTTAHPMNSDLFNDGWEIPLTCDDELGLEIDSIDTSNFSTYSNLIVARPYKDVSSFYCTYTSYPNIVFKDFLFN